MAYATWLSRKTAKSYRLLTEAEWEYAARAGSVTARPWGDSPDDACTHANIGDLALDQLLLLKGQKISQTHKCDDGYPNTAPVGKFAANRFGLHDMIGNAAEWTADCWNENYTGAAADGTARMTGQCAVRVARGAAWGSNPRYARSADRYWGTAGFRSFHLGFRLARTL